jgi:type VI secretion system protein ImpH
VSGHHAIAENPEQLSFFDVLRKLERTTQGKPRIGNSSNHDEDIVVLGQMPYVEFPDSNVAYFAMDAQGRYHVHSKFLGMLGPQGALPLAQTYEARHWIDMRDPAFARFLDLFNNRFLQLFFRAWADARPCAQFDRPEEDRFSAFVGAAIGMATPAFCNRSRVNDFVLLSTAGLLSSAVKSASRLESLLQHVFKTDAEIEQFSGMWLPLERIDQTSLGGLNALLGDSALLGSAVYSLQDKFRIRITAKTLKGFEEFLPDGRHCDDLADLVFFYLGDVHAYDVEIGLPESETLSACLGTFGRLGWTSWMKPEDKTVVGTYRWDCHFHPAQRASP